ncbi:MAG: DinB family protein [Gammaproteobacteria bacterium]
MALIDGLLQELEEEARTTRRVLERVPDNQLTWRPHKKARTLGELALHVASVPGGVAEMAVHSPVQAPRFTDPSPSSASELIPALNQSIARAKKLLAGMDDATLMTTWRMMQGERELFAIPRVALLRSIMLNHWYHHRGQLTVYLRELGVPIPSIYGPSADENPFATTDR